MVEESKNKPLDPLSMKLVGRLLPARTVVISPNESVVRTTPDPIWLLVCVPMPKINDPVKLVAPAVPTAGRSITHKSVI